jgi:sensor histidine kinase YesM
MLVFGLWYFLRYQDYPDAERGLRVSFIKVADLALMIYITNLVLIPRLLYKKHYLLFAACFIILVFASSVIKMNILGWILNSPAEYFNFSGNLKTRIYDNIIPHFFLVMAGAAVKLMLDYGKLQQRMAESARDKAEAELNFLKSQINPHFLFNSLNSVYFLIDKNNNEARSALHKFSEMLRYQLYEMNGDTIPVEKEISYLQDYVDLQKLRKDDHYEVSFNSSASVKGFRIPPLLLVPFVENAFKHISHLKDRPNFIWIDLDRKNDELSFSIENSKEAVDRTNEQPGGIGLANVKRRLELLYPGMHNLVISDTDRSFKVDLSIKLN